MLVLLFVSSCLVSDPLDVVEIGSEALEMGSIHKVKVLGVLPMIDSGELDWKVLAIRAQDPLAEVLNDVEDIEKRCPGVVSGIREYLRWYKTPDGKPLNRFGYDEKCLNRAFALDVIAETNEYWEKLRKGLSKHDNLWIGEK